MQDILDLCCGIDVHKEFVVACILKTADSQTQGNVSKEIRTFKTFIDDLISLKAWIESNGCHHVAMESTGVYWYPVYDALEPAFGGDIEILVTNARHMHNVPGKKTDIKDSEWIASLLRAGLLNGSFIPPQEVRELRQLTSYRKNIVGDISTQKNRIEKSLQQAGIKLSTFLSDVFGVSGRNLINVLIGKGRITPIDVDSEVKRVASAKKEEIKIAINGRLNQHQRDFLKLQMALLDQMNSHLTNIDASISELSAKFGDQIELLDSIPGIAQTAATAIIAEIGIDMSKFPTAERFCSWAGVTPGNNESAGKKKIQESLLAIPISKV
jgi:transposase